MTLDRRDGALGVGNCLTLCRLTNQTLAGLRECNNGRGSSGALAVRDHDGLSALHNRHAAVGCSQINADDLAHKFILLIIS